MKIDYDYFLKEYHGFRAILGSTEYTIEQKTKAWEGLLTVYVNIENMTEDEEAVCQSAMLSMAHGVGSYWGFGSIDPGSTGETR